MASTTKLIVYNAALRELGTARLANITSANTRLDELNGAWDHAVEHVLAMRDWGFARRRAALTGVTDTSFPPYVYRYTKPADYLRKCWVKTAADDEFEVDHAEIAAVFYAMNETALLEYVSDDSANYDPANWPAHYTKVLTLYLAALVAPKLARAGAEDLGRLNAQMSAALDEADRFEALFLTNVAIAAERQPVMRRALEFVGQQLAGSVAIHSHTNMLRWHMNRSWDHAVRYVLEQGAWNFATRRAILYEGDDPAPAVQFGLSGSVYWWLPMLATIPPSDDDDAEIEPSEWDYGYALPEAFLHKVWIKSDPNDDIETSHQFMRNAVYTNVEPAVMEFIAWDNHSRSPGSWSANFMEAVAAYLALLVTPELLVEQGAKGGIKVGANEIKVKMEAVFRNKLSDAKLRDAIQQEPKRLPVGRFVRARAGTTSNLRRYN